MFAVAFVSGLAVSIPLMLMGRIGRQVAIPFGPFLAFAGMLLFTLPDIGPAIQKLFVF